jgi:hypothetical protein
LCQILVERARGVVTLPRVIFARVWRLSSLAELTPRRSLVCQIPLVAVAIGPGNPMSDGILSGVMQAAHQGVSATRPSRPHPSDQDR